MKDEGYKTRIRDLPSEERPRERLRDYGPKHLNNSELLAILLRTGNPNESAVNLATRLISHFGGLDGLALASMTELSALKGMGLAKAAQVQAALELGKRLLAAHPDERYTVRAPGDVFNLLRAEMALLEQERLRVLLLNTKNQVMGIPEVYRGSVNTSLIRVAEVFREAIRENCPSIIVVHNHPSGDPTPSPEDVRVTQQLFEAGKLLDIELLDHIVIGRNAFVSMKEKRLGFS